MRIDKYIWCVRLTKTRSLATQLCEKERIRMNSVIVKPSKELKAGDIFELRENPIWRSFKVLDFPKSRVGAKLVSTFIMEQTSEADLSELELMRKMNSENRNFGLIGRPTKRHRRDLDRFTKR